LFAFLSIAIRDLEDNVPEKKRFNNNHIHNGFIGEVNLGRNVFCLDNLVASAGLNMADHFIVNKGNSGEEDDGHDTAGLDAFYISIGGYAHVDFAITDWLAARITVSASKAVYSKNAAVSAKEYRPLFLSINPELFTTYGLFIGMDYYEPIHDNPVKQKRFDFKAGIRF